MPLQNRVDPFGDIRATAARGLFTGNRGAIHDPDTKTLHKRRWTTKAWIICDLVHPRGATREVFGRNTPSGGAGWTELFFADEVTALAAGHRPCFYCRRPDARRFQSCFAAGNSLARVSAPSMDGLLHDQRPLSGGPRPVLDAAAIAALPDGAVIVSRGGPFAVLRDTLLPWNHAGYDRPIAAGAFDPAETTLVTPLSTVAALRSGFKPVWHPSAGA